MRVAELDFLRGWALVTITLNHYTYFVRSLDYTGLRIPTLTQLGYSGSAELFFLLSGYLVGLLYVPAHGGASLRAASAKLVGRSAYLLAMNCMLFVCILASAYFFPEEVRASLGFDSFVEAPYFAAAQVILLGYHLPLLGILNFYIIMMIAAVPFIALLLRNQAAAILGSLGIYVVAYFAPWLSLPGGGLQGGGRMAFNPMAWQILFMGALIAGRQRAHDAIRERIALRTKGFLALAAIFLGLTALFLVDEKLTSGVFPSRWSVKQDLGPLRVVHAVVTLSLLLSILFRFEWFGKTRLFAWVAMIGRNSLPCFMSSVLLSYFMAVFWGTKSTTVAYFLIGFSGCLALLGCAALFEFHRKATKGLSTRPLGVAGPRPPVSSRALEPSD